MITSDINLHQRQTLQINPNYVTVRQSTMRKMSTTYQAIEGFNMTKCKMIPTRKQTLIFTKTYLDEKPIWYRNKQELLNPQIAWRVV